MRLRTDLTTREFTAALPALLGAGAATGVLIWPALRPGYALYFDHVTVPSPARPSWEALMSPSGLRGWPLDGVAWLWSQVLPSWALQHTVLVMALFGAGLGAGLVLRRWGGPAAFAASILAVANPYVAERLLLGQTVLLLGYAALPWIVIASRQRTVCHRLAMVTLASAPAALTPWGSILAAVGAFGLALARRRSWSEVGAQLVASSLWLLPWLVPALAGSSGGADPRGAVAFRLADDLGVGTLLAALGGGGVWSAAASLGSPAGLLGGAGVALLLGLAALGLAVMRQRTGQRAWVVAAVAVAVPVLAAAVSGPALEFWARAQAIPGVALFRDVHRGLAPAVVATVLLASIGLGRLVAAVTREDRRIRVALGALVPICLAAVLVPSAPSRIHAAYKPQPFSADWSRSLGAVEEGRVLSLPWQPLRRVPWMAQTFLDPTPKALGARALTDTTLTVSRNGEEIVVADPSATHAEQNFVDTLRPYLTHPAGEPLPSGLLTSNGVSHILIWNGSPGFLPQLPDGWHVTQTSQDFVVWSRITVSVR